MKSKNLKNVVYLFLALAFSVAVSGGCGGGSSGHYSGDFGDSGESSQEIMIEDVSQDVPPAPIPESYDIPVNVDEYADENDDEYGVNGNKNIIKFSDDVFAFRGLSMLNSVDWDIESIRIVDSEGNEMPVFQDSFKTNSNNSNNIKINTLNLSFTNGALKWSNGVGNTLFDSDLTINFKDMSKNLSSVLQTRAAPILRPAKDFKESFNANMSTMDYRADIRVNRNGKSVLIGRQTIRVGQDFPTYAIIENQFVFGYTTFTSYLRLKASYSDSFFKSINNTTWQVKSIDVVGLIKDRKGKIQNDAPVNYPVDNFNFGTITVLTSIDNNGRILNFKNENGQVINDPLTATFTDNRRYVSNLSAPILRPASHFIYKGKQGNEENGYTSYTVFEANLVQSPTNPYPVNELLYITKYGPEGNIVLNNSFYIPNPKNLKQVYLYWVTVYLEPYKPEPEPEPERVSEYELFEKLNNTSWNIVDIAFRPKDTIEYGVVDVKDITNYNCNVEKLTLQVSKDQLVWFDGDENLHNNWKDPLTVKIVDNKPNFEAPILRAGSGFTELESGYNNTSYKVSFENLDTETIIVQTSDPSSDLMIFNDFKVSFDNGMKLESVKYEIVINLKPYKDKGN